MAKINWAYRRCPLVYTRFRPLNFSRGIGELPSSTKITLSFRPLNFSRGIGAGKQARRRKESFRPLNFSRGIGVKCFLE